MTYNYIDVCRFVDLIRACHSEAKTFTRTEFPDIVGYAPLRKQHLETKVAAQQFCRLCNELAHYVCKSGALEDARENLERKSAQEFTSFLNATVASLSECTRQYKVLARELEKLKETSSLVDLPFIGEVEPITAALLAGVLGAAIGVSAPLAGLLEGEPQKPEVALALGVGSGAICFGLAYFAWKPEVQELQNDRIRAIFASSDRLRAKMREISSSEACLQVSRAEAARLPDDLFRIKGFLSGLKDSLEPCLQSV